jgi:hypothetical protein
LSGLLCAMMANCLVSVVGPAGPVSPVRLTVIAYEPGSLIARIRSSATPAGMLSPIPGTSTPFFVACQFVSVTIPSVALMCSPTWRGTVVDVWSIVTSRVIGTRGPQNVVQT